MSQPDITVVIPAYDEAENLDRVVTEASGFLDDLSLTWELIIVNDGSQDGTESLAEKLAARNSRIRAIHHQTNQGLGAALKTGYAAGRGDLISYFPADGQFPVTELTKLMPLLDDYEIVLTRPPSDAKSPFRLFLSKGQLFLTKIIVAEFRWKHGIPRLFERSILNELHLDSNTGFVNLELTIKAARLGYTMTEVEISTRPRFSGRSKVTNFRTVIRTYREMLRLRKNLANTIRRPS